MKRPSIEDRLAQIERRNAKVELDKSWETSWTRRLSIAALTYVVVVVYLFVIGNDKPFINAVVPPTGFMLSTLVVRRIRYIWQDRKR
jgi:hypothetical protein